MKRNIAWLLFITALTFFLPQIAFSGANDEPRITVQELKAKIDNGEDIVIIDVRSGMEYDRSKYKIKGSTRIPLSRLAEKSKEIPQDKEIITYCT